MAGFESRTLYPAAARSATVTGSDQFNEGHIGLHLIVNLTVQAGAETVTPKIQGKDANGNWYDLLVGAPIASVSQVVYRLYPGATVAANLAVSDALPAVWRVVMTHSASGAHTYSVAVNLLPGDTVAEELTDASARNVLQMRSGMYYFTTPTSSTGTSVALGNGTARATPFYVPNDVTLTRIGAEVTLVGEAGSKVRLGIYADNGADYPGALLLDAGQIAGDSATVQELTISQALTAGLYWVVSVVQAAPATQPTLRVPGVMSFPGAGLGLPSIPGVNTTSIGYAQSGVTGALGTPWTVTPSSSGVSARVFVKVA